MSRNLTALIALVAVVGISVAVGFSLLQKEGKSGGSGRPQLVTPEGKDQPKDGKSGDKGTAGKVREIPKESDQAAVKLLERAIREHGGTTALERARTMVRTAKGFSRDEGQNLPCTMDVFCDLPDRYRVDAEAQAGQQTVRITAIVLPDRAWKIVNGTVGEMPAPQHAEHMAEGYVLYLSTLVPIRDGRGFILKSLPERQVWDKPAVGIEVFRQNQPNFNLQLFFDKASGLLVYMRRTGGSDSGLETVREYLLGEHKEVNGVKLPTVYIEKQNGTEAAHFKSMTYKFPSKPDERQFVKP